jgi:hypothetical protein
MVYYGSNRTSPKERQRANQDPSKIMFAVNYFLS